MEEIMGSSWTSFPKVWGLGHKALEGLLDGDVVVQEKIDGSQFSFGMFNGQLRLRSKGQEMHPDAPEKLFAHAVETVRGIASQLTEGWTYRAEYLAKPKHNVLVYNRTPHNYLILFDINVGYEDYCSPDRVASEASRLELEAVPTLYDGPGGSLNLEWLVAALERESGLGGTKIEGVVLKNYAWFGLDKKVLMGKYVSEAFKEKHKREWKPGQNIVEVLAQTLATPARWAKSVQHAMEDGVLEQSPRDIGLLISRIKTDVAEEEKEWIAKNLMANILPKILRGCTAGFPEFYKTLLAEKQFGKKEEEHEAI